MASHILLAEEVWAFNDTRPNHEECGSDVLLVQVVEEIGCCIKPVSDEINTSKKPNALYGAGPSSKDTPQVFLSGQKVTSIRKPLERVTLWNGFA